jgi:hypothetical protein
MIKLIINAYKTFYTKKIKGRTKVEEALFQGMKLLQIESGHLKIDTSCPILKIFGVHLLINILFYTYLFIT